MYILVSMLSQHLRDGMSAVFGSMQKGIATAKSRIHSGFVCSVYILTVQCALVLLITNKYRHHQFCMRAHAFNPRPSSLGCAPKQPALSMSSEWPRTVCSLLIGTSLMSHPRVHAITHSAACNLARSLMPRGTQVGGRYSVVTLGGARQSRSSPACMCTAPGSLAPFC